jgi:hypothetical protein
MLSSSMIQKVQDLSDTSVTNMHRLKNTLLQNSISSVNITSHALDKGRLNLQASLG